MDKIELVVLFVYTVLVGLYPTGFRREFEAEMRTVFSQALRAACPLGLRAVLRLCSRELTELPRALMREHWGSGREKEVEMRKNIRSTTHQGGTGPISERKEPDQSWGEIALGMLPFVLILLLDAVPMILVDTGLLTIESPALQILTSALTILMIVTFLGVFFVSWRQKWPQWSASWYLFFVLVPFLLISWLLSSLLDKNSINSLNIQSVYVYQVIPLVIAALLYAVTRLDRLRGMLAALPVIYILWLSNMEFVSDPIEVSIKVISTALICVAIVFLLRRRDWRLGLYAILGVNLVVGILFSFAGIYHGGSLPFTAPEPNLVELLRSMIPQYLATGAILLGPLFALKIRQVGRAGGRVGNTGYHLALLGLLLVIITNLASLMMTIDPPSRPMTFFNRSVLEVEIIFGLGAYMIGLFMIYRGAQFAREASVWVELSLLAVLPLAVPFALISPFITWKWPVSSLYGIPLLWELPHAFTLSFGLFWLLLSIWLVTRDSGYSTPLASLGEPSKAPLLS